MHAAAPAPAPDLADRVLRRTAATPQRRRWTGWFAVVPALGSVAVVVVVLFIGLQLWRLGPGPIAPLASPSAVQPSPSAVQPSPSAVQPSPSLILPPPELSPSPSSTLSPSPSSSPSPEVFPNGQRCHNDSIGYRVSYPAGWWANEELPPVEGLYPRHPPCMGFAPTEFDLNCCAGEVVPAIYFRLGRGTRLIGEVIFREETTVDGRPATVSEIRQTEDMYFPAGTRLYKYVIDLGGGDILVVDTDSLRPDGDYPRDKRVIDKIMHTLRFDP